MKIVKTRVYIRAVKRIGITARDEARLFEELRQSPKSGALIVGGGGIRKIRVALGNRGKSAGARVIYTFFEIDNQIYLLTAYLKSEKSNLSQSEINLLKEFAKTIK